MLSAVKLTTNKSNNYANGVNPNNLVSHNVVVVFSFFVFTYCTWSRAQGPGSVYYTFAHICRWCYYICQSHKESHTEITASRWAWMIFLEPNHQWVLIRNNKYKHIHKKLNTFKYKLLRYYWPCPAHHSQGICREWSKAAFLHCWLG